MFHSVAMDDCLGARLAVEHLVSLGHTSIGYIGVGDRSRSNQQRLEGYRKALTAGLPQITDWVAVNDKDYTRTDDVATGQQMVSKLFTAGVTSNR